MSTPLPPPDRGQTVIGFDAQMRSALADVVVPSGLQERLLLRLTGQDAHAQGASPLTPFDNTLDRWGQNRSPTVSQRERELVGPLSYRPRLAKLGWRAVVVTLAAAAAVLLAIWLQPSSGELSTEQILWAAAELPLEPQAGQLLADEPPAADYAPPASLQLSGEVRWRDVRGFLGRAGIAYEWTTRGGMHAALYVVDLNRPRSAPKLVGLTGSHADYVLTTAGATMSAWQDGNRLLVLVVRGGEDDFRQLFNEGLLAYHNP